MGTSKASSQRPVKCEFTLEGDPMYSNRDDQIQETNRQHASLTQQLLGVLEEEEYFARQEVELRRKLAEERHAKLLAEERERERTLHLMKCPKCGMQLEEIAFGDVRSISVFLAMASGWTRGNSSSSEQKEGGFMGRMWSVFR